MCNENWRDKTVQERQVKISFGGKIALGVEIQLELKYYIPYLIIILTQI